MSFFPIAVTVTVGGVLLRCVSIIAAVKVHFHYCCLKSFRSLNCLKNDRSTFW